MKKKIIKQTKTVVYTTEDIAKKAKEDNAKYKPSQKRLDNGYKSYVKWYKSIEKRMMENTEKAIGKENMVPGENYMKEKMFTKKQYEDIYVKMKRKIIESGNTVELKSINRTLARQQGFELSEKQMESSLNGYKNYKRMHKEDDLNLKLEDLRYNPKKRDAWSEILKNLTENNGQQWVRQNIFGSTMGASGIVGS